MRKLYKYPWLIIFVITVITIFFAFQLPKAELENNNLRFVPPDDPALNTSRWIDGMFGSSFFILVGLERRYGTIFESEFLVLMQKYVNAVKEIPIVRNVVSLINTDYITSSDDTIIVEKLVNDNFSGTVEEIAELKRRLLSWDMYERALYSDDFTATQILIPLTINSEQASSKEVTEYFIQIRNMAHDIFAGNADKDGGTEGSTMVYVTGMPIIITTVNEAMNNDLKLLIPLVILVVLFVLFFSFRKFMPVVLPMLTVLISCIWSIGAMPLFGIKLSVISTVLPVILVAVGSAYGIHVVTHYLAALGERRASGAGKNNSNAGNIDGSDINLLSADKQQHRELVLEVVTKIQKPVFLAALTTFVGFCSFCFTSVAPCREFGYFSSFGVAAAFITAITLIPALLIIRGPGKIKNGKANSEKITENSSFSIFVADNLTSIAMRKKTVVFFAALVFAFSLYGLSKLIVDNVMIEYFRPDTDIARSDEFIRRQFGGSKVISVVAHADSSEIVLHPDTLAAMDGLSAYLQKKIPGTGKVMGFTDLVKRINQVFNADESPDGLQVTISNTDTTDSYGFDNNFANFGFDNIGDNDNGFDSFTFNDTDDTLEQTSIDSKRIDREKLYTQNELLEIFDRSGNLFRGMNVNDFIWELKRQVNYEGASYYEIPVDPKRYGKQTKEQLQQLVSNYLMLLSGNISEYANDPLEPTAIKSTVQLRTLGMDDSHAIFREIEKYAAQNFPSNVQVTLGGTTMVESSLNNLVVQSQIISMLFSIICVFIIIAISNKSLIAGLIGMTPLSISILLNFAIMGFSGIKLNLGTSMVAAVSVGIGIDYTIHCLEAYKREYRATNRQGDSMRRVFLSSGKAIIINALSVGAGFAVLLFSRFVMLADLGLLIAFTMFSSALVSLTVLPALLSLIKPKFVTK